jgi:hypothetical protein
VLVVTVVCGVVRAGFVCVACPCCFVRGSCAKDHDDDDKDDNNKDDNNGDDDDEHNNSDSNSGQRQRQWLQQRWPGAQTTIN